MNLLIVDDIEANRKLLRAILEAEGATVHHAVDGCEALEFLQTNTVDAVISDILMPRMDGYRLCYELRRLERTKELPFIFYTSTYTSESDEKLGLEMGADRFLRKPAPLRTIVELMDDLKAGRVRTAKAEKPVVPEVTLMIEYNAALVSKLEQRNAELTTALTDLRQQEERFRQLAESIREVFWLSEPSSNRIIYVSPAFETIWGRSCESLYRSPQSWLECIHPDDRERVVEAARTKQAAGTYEEYYRVMRPDGSMRWIRDRAFPVKNEAGTVYRVAGVAEDITEHRRLEEQFRQAQKMEAIGTLAGGIAHDFNNILTAIYGYTELARGSVGPEHEAQEYLDAVVQASIRATELVRQILAFSRHHTQQRQPMQLRYVIAESLKLLRATIPVTIKFDVALDSDVPTVLADATQIQQVMLNLGTNAWHAMRERPGRLEVKLEKFFVSEDLAATNPSLRAGRYARLTVSDTGHGIDLVPLERIFEPFFTTKGPGEGTGLGLAVVHGIVQSHEGAITVYSQPGEGTSFHLYFPVHGGEETDTTGEKPAVPSGRGQRILFVDDEAPLARLGEKMLGQMGYAVESHTVPAEALERLRRDPGHFDLVITDLTMPKMTGIDLAREMLAVRPDLPIVLTTGFTASLTPERIRAMGLRAMLLKPLTPQELGRAVSEVLTSAQD